jgi:hypothetical protein
MDISRIESGIIVNSSIIKNQVGIGAIFIKKHLDINNADSRSERTPVNDPYFVYV